MSVEIYLTNLSKRRTMNLIFVQCCLLIIFSKHTDAKKYYEHLNGIDYTRSNDVSHYEKHAYSTTTNPPPPPPGEAARMARYVVHTTDWASVGTISVMPSIKSFPFTAILSVSDGPVNNSSGIPYFYITPLDTVSQDIQHDYRCSVTMTLAELDYCKNKPYDPEDPRCSRVTLTGKMKRVKEYSPELEFAQEALFSRHPVMKTWPKNHGFYFAKLKIQQVALFDDFGGMKFISLKDYLSAQPQ